MTTRSVNEVQDFSFPSEGIAVFLVLFQLFWNKNIGVPHLHAGGGDRIGSWHLTVKHAFLMSTLVLHKPTLLQSLAERKKSQEKE